MSFRVSLYIVPHVRSYDEARAFHAKAAKKPWRNTSRTPVNSYNTAYYADHALPGKRSRTCGVRMENENIVFRLHTTDVITWRPDGSVRVSVYHSQSTREFINHFIPRRMWFNLHPHGYVLRKLDGYVAIPLRGDFTIFPDGTIGETEPTVFALPRINKPVAKRRREEVGYPAFAKWRKIMEPVLAGVPSDRVMMYTARARLLDATGYAAALQNEEFWPDFLIAKRSNGDILAHLYAEAALTSDLYWFECFDTVRWRNTSEFTYPRLSRYTLAYPTGNVANN
jgi:hypothetical protein